MIDPIPVGYVSLDEATMQLAAVICDEQLRNVGRRFSGDYDPAKGTPAELQWSKRELAICKLHEALRDGVLTGFVREPDKGDFFRLSGTDWHSLRRWRETIISGFIRAWPEDLLVRHEESPRWQRRRQQASPSPSKPTRRASSSSLAQRGFAGQLGRGTAFHSAMPSMLPCCTSDLNRRYLS
jgi:hypothetical protein